MAGNRANNSKKVVFLTIIFLLIVAFGTMKAFTFLKNSQKDKALMQQYSYFSQATQKIAFADMEDIGCSYHENGAIVTYGCKEFYKNLLRGIKVRKYCQDNALEQKCIPVYKKYSTNPKCPGFSKEMFDKYNDALVTVNNTIIIIANDAEKVRLPMFAVDINGFDEPNIPGLDLFMFIIEQKEGGGYTLTQDHTKCIDTTDTSEKK